MRNPTMGSEVLPYFLGRCGRRWNAVPTIVPSFALLPWEVRTAMERRKKRQECRFPEWPRRSAALPVRSRRGATLPWFRAGGGYSVPLFAARSRHEKPYPPMSKINLAFPFTVPFKGNAGKYTPFICRFQAGILKIEVLRAV